MKTKILLGCLVCSLLVGGALFLHTSTVSARKAPQQKAAAASTGTRLKLLRRVEREHFGGSLADALRWNPAAGKAFDVVGITATPKKGFSFWNAEGGVLVVLDYDAAAGTAVATEVLLAPVETIDPYRTCLQLVHQAILRKIKRIAQILILVSLVASSPSQFFHSTRH